jgi:probable selenium-dependent hydroxylase accessory protein YqeC
MQKTEILRVFSEVNPDTICVSGAGGKSSFLNLMACSYGGQAILTTTTHLGKEQSSLAETHVILEPDDQVSKMLLNAGKSVLVTAGKNHEGRWCALTDQQLEDLHYLCRSTNRLLIVEADGSRGLPIKAPAQQEPVIPAFADMWVYVLGLSAIGKPLNDQIAHRPELIAQITNTGLGETIVLKTLIELFISLRAGLKAAPPGSKRIAILNQLDVCQISESTIIEEAKALTDAGYDYIWVGSLGKTAK